MIWISEIILQQTRINQGLNYYLNFIEKFPDIQSLAQAPEVEVLKTWQGLGYYSRARNLHQTANVIVNMHKGQFPSQYEEIRQLKGIGDYTAAAIASICFNQPYPVIDGNVLRVMSRIMALEQPVNAGKTKKIILRNLETLISKEQPGQFNQAMMELGAIICKVNKPDCLKCPLADMCLAFSSGTVDNFPVKLPKSPPLSRRIIYMVFMLKENNKRFTWIRKRNSGDIWQGLFDFPSFEPENEPDESLVLQAIKKQTGNNAFKIRWSSDTFKHLLTHRLLLISYLIIDIETNLVHPHNEMLIKTDWNNLTDFPVPKPLEKIITFLSENSNLYSNS